MKTLTLLAAVALNSICALAQTNTFTPPPTIVTPPVTGSVLRVHSTVVTNVTTSVVTNRVMQNVPVVYTNATLRRFVIDIDTNQTPTQFTSYMSDSSVIVTAAGNVGALTNRAALSIFNGLLGDVVGSGHRFVFTNRVPHAVGTNVVWNPLFSNAQLRVLGAATNAPMHQ